LVDAFSRHNLELAIAEVRRSVTDMAAHAEPDYVSYAIDAVGGDLPAGSGRSSLMIGRR
jgi:hypothetical protein